jgi:GR25 family glycosyltransferase involved in LPS biosynthesis
MKVKVINLDHRTDRWELMQKNLVKFCITNFERQSAFSQPNALHGNAKSHIKCLEDGVDLIFEDDIWFVKDARMYFDMAVKELPAGWDMLCLGGNVLRPIKRVSDHLYRCEHTWGSNAILYSEKGREKVLKNYRPFDGKFDIYDDWLRKHYSTILEAYITFPILVWPVSNYSDVWNKQVNYTVIMKANAAKNMR